MAIAAVTAVITPVIPPIVIPPIVAVPPVVTPMLNFLDSIRRRRGHARRSRKWCR
jgi:hypothetical protein